MTEQEKWSVENARLHAHWREVGATYEDAVDTAIIEVWREHRDAPGEVLAAMARQQVMSLRDATRTAAAAAAAHHGKIGDAQIQVGKASERPWWAEEKADPPAE